MEAGLLKAQQLAYGPDGTIRDGQGMRVILGMGLKVTNG